MAKLKKKKVVVERTIGAMSGTMGRVAPVKLKKPKLKNMVRSHKLIETSNPNVLKLIDTNGDWTHYFLKKEKIYVPAMNHIIRSGFPKGERFYKYLANTPKEEIERKLLFKGDAGTRTHEAIRKLINGIKITQSMPFWSETEHRNAPLTFAEWENLDAFNNFCTKYKPEVIIHEHTLANEVCAGTLDFLGLLNVPADDDTFPKHLRGKKVLILLDWKTSAAIWDEYKLQSAGYKLLAMDTNYIVAKIPKPYRDGECLTGVLRIGTQHKCGYEFEVWDGKQTAEHEMLLSQCIDTYRFVTKEKRGQSPKMVELPPYYAIKVPRVAVK